MKFANKDILYDFESENNQVVWDYEKPKGGDVKN